MSERTRRLDHLFQEEISAIIRRDVQDPRVGFVTITSVDVSPDLRHATVWASIIGSDEERRASMKALGRAMPFVRHHLGRLRLKRIPELHLREDDSAQRGTRVMQLLDHLETEVVEADAPDAGEERGSSADADGLPSPRTLNADQDPFAEAEPPLPPGHRRRVDRVAIRKARARRGR